MPDHGDLHSKDFPMKALILIIWFIVLLSLLIPSNGICDSKYVQVKNGKFYLQDSRIKFWGVHLPLSVVYSHKKIDHVILRIKKAGFNAICLWPTHYTFYDHYRKSHKKFGAYKKGDGSSMDLFDYLVYRCKQEGIWIWMTALGYMPYFKQADYDILPSEGGKDEREWKAAISQINSQYDLRREYTSLRIVDDRLRKLMLVHQKDFLNHFNQYTQKRNKEEEIIALYELGDEVNFVLKMRWGNFEKWPDYFKDKFKAKWNK